MKAPPAFTPKQLGQIAKDNQAAQDALAKRSDALDKTMQTVDDKLAHDGSLSAYPDAQDRLRNIRQSAESGQSVIQKEQGIRQRLATAAEAGDSDGVRSAQADLAALKKDNPKIYGKSAVAAPVTECPDAISGTNCDSAVSNVNYLGTKGPSSPLSPNSPCYGTSLAEWNGWDELIAHGCATAEERDMITAMSENEGSFEAVQSYDSQALTVGAMQKTVNTTGGGEFTQQLADFKAKDPDSYQRLFASQGWTEEGGKTYFKDAAGTKRTGEQLQSYLRSASHANQVKALAPLRLAGRDDAFRKQQVCDFIKRAHQATDRGIDVGKDEFAAGDFITSTRGKAMLLDSSVNGGPAEGTFQSAVNWFYQSNPKAGKDPKAWSAEERAKYEPILADRYAATRRVAAPVAETRAKRNKALSGLSDTPKPDGLASQRPARNCPDCG
ncbi:hypothetical protein BurJ1DRAFT_4411 [Burkholderiales bacterium JOSHI_001]|nr:hypothetical protein BurJ1DRAFT_4411 [Burkholderiales bacterium JOSHI_001]